MKIKYVIPEAKTTGGIQNLANIIREELTENYDYSFETTDYQHSVHFIPSLIADKLPNFFKPFISDQFFIPSIQKANKYYDAEFFHCWHIDTALSIPSNKKYVLTTHGLEILPNFLNAHWFRKLYSQKAVQRAQIITCDSQYTKELLISSFPEINQSKLHVIYPPIRFDQYISKPKSSPEITIGTLCRFVARKNIKNIISALNILYDKFPNFTYHLAGDGTEKEAILNQLQESKFKWKYLGKISDNKKIKNFFPSLDVFVMPTLASEDDVEGFGIVYLEANASGIPVVSAKSGGATEAIAEDISGLFTNPSDPNDIADKIYSIITSHNFNERDIRNWAKKFDIEEAGKQFNEVYQLAFQ